MQDVDEVHDRRNACTQHIVFLATTTAAAATTATTAFAPTARLLLVPVLVEVEDVVHGQRAVLGHRIDEIFQEQHHLVLAAAAAAAAAMILFSSTTSRKQAVRGTTTTTAHHVQEAFL